MKKILKQSFSLILALLMVLSMVPAMSLVADAAVEYGISKLQVSSTYKIMNLDFETKDHDYVYYGTEAYDWAVTTNSTHTKNVGVKVDITLEAGGQTKTHSVTKTIAAGQRTVLVDYSTVAPVLPTTYFGDIRMTVDLWIDEQTQIAQMIVVFGRKAEVSSAGQSRWNYLRTSSATDGTGTFEYLNGAINFADNSWTVTLNPTKSVDLSTATIDAQILDAKGNVIDSVEGKAITANPVLSLNDFSVAKSKIGTYAVKATFKAGSTPVAQLTAIYKLAPAAPGAVWAYANGGDALTGKFVTKDPDMVYGAGQDYDWYVTLGPISAEASYNVTASIVDENGAAVGEAVTKQVTLPKATAESKDPTVVLSAEEFAALTSDLTGTFTLTLAVTNPTSGKGYAQLIATFARTAEPGAYPGKVQGEVLPGYENKITPKFVYADEDLVYIGAQAYDWKLTMGSTIDWTSVDVIANIKNGAGEIIMDCNKTVERTAATETLLTPEDFDDLTIDLYGKFTLYCEVKMGDTTYVRMQVTFSRIEGATPEDTVAPTLNYTTWEGCGIPPILEIQNESQFAKEVTLLITLTQPDGSKITLPTNGVARTFTLEAKHTTTLVKANEMNYAFNSQNGTYTILVDGYWNVDDEAHKINTTVTYVKNDHPEKVLVEAKPATCTEAGWEEHYYCSGCNGTPGGKGTIPALGHDMQETEAAVPATCETAGKTAVLTCANGCGTTEGGEEIPALGHNFVDGTCANGCGATEALTDANLQFYKSNASGGDLRLNNDIRAQFMVALSKLKSYERIYLEIVHKGVTTIVEKDASSNSSLNRYFFVVPAAEMTMDMLVTVCGEKDGVTYRGETLTFSVSNCINVKMAAWKDDASQVNMMKLAVALLNYGEKAQINFGINPDKLATAGLTQEYLDLIPAENPALAEWPTDGAAGKVTIYNHGLILKEKVNVVLVLKNTANFDANASVEIIHHRSKEGDTVTYTFNSSNATISGKNARIVLEELAPAQLRDTIEIVVKDGTGTAISATYQRSVPMIMNQSNYLEGDAKQVELVYAIMKYADAAKLAFG